MLCDACFRLSNHEGHEVFFHRAAPGGCCDCGDPEAWVAEGCCARHRPREGVPLEDEDPAASLPLSLRRAGAAVARAAALAMVEAAVACGASHEAPEAAPEEEKAPVTDDIGSAFLRAALGAGPGGLVDRPDARAARSGARRRDKASRLIKFTILPSYIIFEIPSNAINVSLRTVTQSSVPLSQGSILI